jgi:hypothetical protein
MRWSGTAKPGLYPLITANSPDGGSESTCYTIIIV